MKDKILKIIRIKITVVVVALVLMFIAVQTPWLKRVIANHLINRLSQLTQSEVNIQSYEGLIPLNFDFYKLTFSQKDKVWLSIDRLSLNRTLIRFFLWKKRAIDVAVVHPKLTALPKINHPTSSNFNWPKFPFQKLSVHLNAHLIEIAPELASKEIPQFNTFSSLYIRKYGEILYLKSDLNSADLPGVQLHLTAKGLKRNNHLQVDLSGSDLKHQVSEHFFNIQLPGFEGKISLAGAPDSLIAFFNPQKESQSSFSGTVAGDFIPSEEDTSFFEEFLDEDRLRISSHFDFDNTQGLSFKKLKVEGFHLSFEGQAQLDRHYVFKNALLKGDLSHLNFLSLWTNEPTYGKVHLDVAITGLYKSPAIEAKFTSKVLESDHFHGEKIEGQIALNKKELSFNGNLKAKATINHHPSVVQTEFSILNEKNFSLKELYLQYGQNQLTSPSFKTLGDVYQGRVDFNFGNLSLFSPFVKRALYGNAAGGVILDLDFLHGEAKQKVDLTLQGEHFQVHKMELDQYFFQGEGNLNLKDLASFEGHLFFKNQNMTLAKYQFENVQLILNPKNKSSPYKLETSGDLKISSSGQITKASDHWNLMIRLLKGNLYGETYVLNKSIDLDFSKNQLFFTPLYLKMGPGSLFLNLDSKQKKISAQLEKFPVEILSLFIPKFDIKGYLNLEASFSNLSSNMEGEMTGSVYQLMVEDYHNMPPFRGQFEASLEQKHLKGKGYFYEQNRDQGSVEFNIPLTMHFYPFVLDMHTQAPSNIELNYKGKINPFIQMLLPQNHLLEGNAECAFKLKGPLSHPKVQGYLHLNQGYYENLFLGLVLKNISSKIEAKEDLLELTKFTANDDLEGEVKAKGELSLNTLNHMPFHVDANMNKGRVIQFDFLDATFDGDVTLKGNLKKATLKGDLDVIQANVVIPSRIGSGLPELPVTYLYPKERDCQSNNFRLGPPMPIEFDLKLKVANKATLKGRGLDTVWQGGFEIKGTDCEPKFEGGLKNTEGTFAFGGKVLKLEEGHIQFDGDILKKTHITLRGTTHIHNATITAHLKGPILGPKLSFHSDPPYSQTEILSLILFNEPIQKLTPFQAVALTHSLATLGGTYLGPDIIDKVRRGIGVDQLTFGSSMEDGGDYTTIQVGKYITRHVLITLNRPLSIGTSPFLITAHVKGGVEVQTYFDENEISKILIQWKLSY